MRHAGLELIRDGTDIVEAAAGQTCNRETIARQAMQKTLTVTSMDFAEISDMIGESELIRKVLLKILRFRDQEVTKKETTKILSWLHFDSTAGDKTIARYK